MGSSPNHINTDPTQVQPINTLFQENKQHQSKLKSLTADKESLEKESSLLQSQLHATQSKLHESNQVFSDTEFYSILYTKFYSFNIFLINTFQSRGLINQHFVFVLLLVGCIVYVVIFTLIQLLK